MREPIHERLVDPSQQAERDQRAVPSTPHPGEMRTEAQKDRDRIYYSASFMRLAAVTQISSPDLIQPLLHNRMTHSLKVAQMARTISLGLIQAAGSDGDRRARILKYGGLDASVAEAAGLAHDIGHPPFGHAGESELDMLCVGSESRDGSMKFPRQLDGIDEGFEGNAQTFRMAVKVDGSYTVNYGLKLTAATRAALLKYPWARPLGSAADSGLDPATHKFRTRKFGFYRSEENSFLAARSWVPKTLDNDHQTLEASIMDMADDITYAVHDFEDFVDMGLISPAALVVAISEYLRGDDRVPVFEPLVTDLRDNYADFFDQASFRTALEKLKAPIQEYLARDTAGSKVRNNLLDDLTSRIDVHDTPLGGVGTRVYHHEEARWAWHAIQILKHFVYAYVIRSPDLAVLQQGDTSILREGLGRLKRWAASDDHERLPKRLRELRAWCQSDPSQADERAFIDFLCTLGDTQCRHLVNILAGHEPGRFARSQL